MATAITLTGAHLPAPAPRAPRPRRVLVSGSRARSPRLCRRSLDVSAAAAAGAASSPSAPDAGDSLVWDALDGVSVFAAGTGDAVPLRDLWDPASVSSSSSSPKLISSGHRTILHGGCRGRAAEAFRMLLLVRRSSWELASDLKNSMAKFDSAGAKLIAIGVGTSDKARILADGLPFPLDSLYADPERKAYNVLGLYHGLGRTLFSPASAKIYSRLDSIKEATKNYTLQGTPADLTGVMQQGGMFVFRGKELLYAWRDEGTGDHAPLDDVLSVCCKAPVT